MSITVRPGDKVRYIRKKGQYRRWDIGLQGKVFTVSHVSNNGVSFRVKENTFSFDVSWVEKANILDDEDFEL